MDLGTFEVLIALGCLLLSIYYYVTSNFGYWKKFQVKGPKPLPFFGNYKDVFFARKHETTLFTELYNEYKNEPIVGIFMKNNPRLILKDPDLIRDVLITDFHVFRDRGLEAHEKTNLFLANLVNLEYKRWKPLRTRLSPIFTSGKLKNMFYLIMNCADSFQDYMQKLVSNNDVIECRDLTARFTIDVISVCVFGLNISSLENEHSKFREFGKFRSEDSYRNRLRRCFRLYLPRVYDLVNFLLEPDSTNQNFITPLKESMDYRKKNNFRRNDFVDLLMDVKENSDKLGDFDFTDNLLIAQAFVFFFAGFETSSGTISYALYELAQNHDVQAKLREEILKVRTQNDGKLTYDCIKSMNYLDKVVKETLRKYPLGSVLMRKAECSYNLKNTNVIVPKNTIMHIPVWSIHRDPDIYPNPEVFDPERFNEEQEQIRHPMYYLPFGAGPRNCIGMRFANYQTKVGIAAIIEKFQVDVCDKTFKEYRMQPFSGIIVPRDGLFLKFSKVQEKGTDLPKSFL